MGGQPSLGVPAEQRGKALRHGLGTEFQIPAPPEAQDRHVLDEKMVGADVGHADDATLRRGMTTAARLRLPVAVHAEDPVLTARLGDRARAEGRRSMRDWVASRPVEAELAAIRVALGLAEETGCSLHVVHVSSAGGADLVAQARARGVHATCETCPHYLTLDEDDAARIGALAKCAPPLRSSAEQRALWERVRGGAIDLTSRDLRVAQERIKREMDDPNPEGWENQWYGSGGGAGCAKGCRKGVGAAGSDLLDRLGQIGVQLLPQIARLGDRRQRLQSHRPVKAAAVLQEGHVAAALAGSDVDALELVGIQSNRGAALRPRR